MSSHSDAVKRHKQRVAMHTRIAKAATRVKGKKLKRVALTGALRRGKMKVAKVLRSR